MYEHICDYIKDQLAEYDRKLASGQELSNSEIERGDILSHWEKSILTNHAMKGAGYSERGYSYNYPRYYEERDRDGMSYAPRRDVRGRYSRADEHEAVREHLEMAKREAPDDKTRHEIQRMIDSM